MVQALIMFLPLLFGPPPQPLPIITSCTSLILMSGNITSFMPLTRCCLGLRHHCNSSCASNYSTRYTTVFCYLTSNPNPDYSMRAISGVVYYPMITENIGCGCMFRFRFIKIETQIMTILLVLGDKWRLFYLSPQ